LYLNPDRVLARRELNLLEEAIGKRKNRLPVAHIIGKKEFYSLEFKVTPDTFIPRPETEFIIDTVLNIVYGLRFTVYGKRLTVNSEAKGRAGKRLINIVDLRPSTLDLRPPMYVLLVPLSTSILVNFCLLFF
ncbi:unnamed protein product, partial [marine sediment metagenome]